ncbi:MAG: NrsF family protein [Pseudomonadota bacterium]
MKTEDLIAQLAGDRPEPVASAFYGVGLLLIAMLATMGLSVLLYGVRSDGPTGGAWSVTIWAVLGIMALVSARRMRLPEPPQWLAVLAPFAGLLLLLLVLTGIAYSEGAALVRADHLIHCLQTVGLLAVMPFFAVSFLLRRGAPASPLMAGAMAGLVAGSVGALAYSISCPINDPMASLSAHTLTVLIIAALGALIGTRLYAW